VVVALAVSGCGRSDSTSRDAVESHSITEGVRAPSRSEISDTDIRRFKRLTASRAFVEFWSDLQWQNWVDAVDCYSPDLQRVVGVSNILEALKYQASFYRSVKPVVQQETTRRGLTTVRYSYADPSGTRNLNSTIWRQEHGRWALVFDGFLDTALQAWAQFRTQQITAPNTPKPTKQALKAGIEASELQGRYLQSIRPETPAGPGGASAG